VLDSLAYHDLHHRYLRVPTSLLPALATPLGPEVAFADATIHRGAALGTDSGATARARARGD
jgi:hypothetical protein